MRIQNRKYIASILFVLISFVCFGQAAPPPPVPPPPPGLPIDDYLPVLFIIAIIYGIAKRIKFSKN